ncbi:MAG: EAL domain-containing protein [Spirochaetes bacterium]|jgi:diguanylate cyclase (GGDEF)-like protein/PAS domain S-box-containing protein|nr:EAL domain-containing protein [Spirochaetota bacterium]
MAEKPVNPQQLLEENADLKDRLKNAEQALRDITRSETDALLVPTENGAQLLTLKGSDQSYRTLIENMSEGALTLTREGLVLYSNRRFADMLKTPLEKFIGSEIQHWFEPESLRVIQRLLEDDTPDTSREELTLSATDDTAVPVYISLSHQPADEGPDSFCIVATDLTQQKRNEAMLADARLAHEILEQAGDIIVVCDGTGEIIRYSRKAQSFCSKNLQGHQLEKAFPLRLMDGTSFFSTVSIKNDSPQRVEVKLKYSGKIFYFLISIGHLKGAKDDLLGFAITMTDITERKTQELALRKSKKQLSEALTIAKIGYWEYEIASDEFIFNDQYYSLHKITAEEAGGYRMPTADFVRRLVHADDVSSVVQSIKLALDSSDPDFTTMNETRILTGGGETRWVEVRFKIRKDAKGNTTHLIGINQDITDRKMAELKLLESERRFIDLLENVKLISVMRDREERITYCNDYMFRLTGWQNEEVIGQNWIDLFVPPEIVEQNKKTFADLLQDRPEAWHHESEILTRSGELRLIRWNNTVLHSENGKVIGTASIGEDITEQKKAADRLKYINRVYAVLSGINTLIVHAKDHNELFIKACQIAVKEGGFHMALLCIIDQQTKKIIPVSSVGENIEILTDFKNLLLSGDDVSNTMVGRAVEEKKILFSNDLANDPQSYSSRQFDEKGILAMIVLPLIVAGESVGSLSLYTGEIDFFQEEEINLLKELSNDISFAIDHINKQTRLDYLAYYDELTGLANRNLFLDRLSQYIRSAVQDGHKLAIYQIDLERFKSINASLGRNAGDELLKQVAEWLKVNIGDSNLLARIETDNFAMIMPTVMQDNDLICHLEKTIEGFSRHQFRLDDAVFRINAKIGIAQFPDDGSEADILLRNAEAALKKAKSKGERFLFHTHQMTASVTHKLTMENQLRQAINNEEFVLYYQPKVNLADNKVTSAEALIRWNKPDSKLIPPIKFIPILEETGLIHEVGRWALHKAVNDFLLWREAGLAAVRIAVNVSPLQLRNPGFIEEIKQVIALGSDAAHGLELEITEGLIMENIKHSIATLKVFQAMGITIAIDDFGTGFSSLSYLTRLPVNTLKIDQTFINEMTVGPESLSLVSTIIDLAHSMSLKVVAEGVETQEQYNLLHLLRCEEMQGYLFSKPVPGEIFKTKFLIPHELGKSSK